MAAGRYAPSPTGRLHLGNLRTALLAWLHARLSNIPFILRIDDLDSPRNRDGSLASILADLEWLGLDWDEGPGSPGPNEPYFQSQRLDLYEEAFQALLTRDRVYPCVCSRKDIAEALSAPQGESAQGIYPGTCRPTAGKSTVDPGHPRAWRYRVETGLVHYVDRLLGPRQQDLTRDCGDFVIRRKDGLFAYQLASVVDDGTMGISDVVRGEDLADSTPRQLALMKALGYSPPAFWHVPLLRDKQGLRMAKRDGSDYLEEWVASGGGSRELVGKFAGELGLLEQTQPVTCRELAASLDLKAFSSALSCGSAL